MITLEHVTKSYDGGVRYSVHNLDLHVPEGKLLVLLGGSGCGKTTTLKMINRLIEPTSGRIEVGGRDISQINPVSLRRGIGYVLQSISLFPHLTLAENTALVPRLLQWPATRFPARVDELLEMVHLPPPEYACDCPASSPAASSSGWDSPLRCTVVAFPRCRKRSAIRGSDEAAGKPGKHGAHAGGEPSSRYGKANTTVRGHSVVRSGRATNGRPRRFV